MPSNRPEPAPTEDAAQLLARPSGDEAAQAVVGPVRVSFAGELTNADELRKRWGFDAETAPALVGNAYLKHGERFLAALRGNFAFVLRHEGTSALLAARDPMGVHPLFYAEVSGELAFADSIDVLLEQPGVGRELNRLALAQYVRLHWPERAETYFEAIRRVPPGHALSVTSGKRRIYRYWDPGGTDGEVEWIERNELDRFEELLEGAVARELEAGPAGIFLSGGLDSVSVAGVAVDWCRRQGLEEPWALSLVFPHAEANEEHVQRGVARDLGLRQVVLGFDTAVGPRGVLAEAAAVSASWPLPLLNTWYPAYRSLADEGARRGCRVILTGSGGDEWLGVSPLVAADLLRAGNVLGLLRTWRIASRSFPLARRRILRSLLWTFGTKQLLLAGGERLRPDVLRARRQRHALSEMPPWFGEDEGLRAQILERIGSETPRPNRGSFYLKEMRRALDHSVVSMEMEENFEIGRRSGIPYAAPYWHPDLVDFLFRTPPDILNDGGRTKGLARRMLARRFPRLGFDRQRKVLASNFFANVMFREAQKVFAELEGVKALDALGIVRGTSFQIILQKAIQTGHNTRITQMWHVLNAEAWARSRLRERG